MSIPRGGGDPDAGQVDFDDRRTILAQVPRDGRLSQPLVVLEGVGPYETGPRSQDDIDETKRVIRQIPRSR